jgi:hypothetical protein
LTGSISNQTLGVWAMMMVIRGGQAQARFGLWLAEIPEVVLPLPYGRRLRRDIAYYHRLYWRLLYSLGQLPWATRRIEAHAVFGN